MKQLTTIILLAVATATITAIIGITTTTTTMVYAQAPNDPNFHGQVTSQATQDFRNEGNPSGFGQHASDPTGFGPSSGDGRNGLSQALTGHGDPQHPSDVIGFLCTNFGFEGCP